MFIGRVRRAMTPNRSPPGGPMVLWILGFVIDRLTLADFRDVGLLDV